MKFQWELKEGFRVISHMYASGETTEMMTQTLENQVRKLGSGSDARAVNWAMDVFKSLSE